MTKATNCHRPCALERGKVKRQKVPRRNQSELIRDELAHADAAAVRKQGTVSSAHICAVPHEPALWTLRRGTIDQPRCWLPHPKWSRKAVGFDASFEHLLQIDLRRPGQHRCRSL
jgi:hypothetical protein